MGNKYTTVDLVLGEIPGTVPAELDSDKIGQYIEDASRYVDSMLPNYEGFADIAGTPATPPAIEKIARLIAAHDCLVFAGLIRGEPNSGSELRDIADKMLDRLYAPEGDSPRAMIAPAEYDYGKTNSRETARKLDANEPKKFYHAPISADDDPGGDVEDN